MAFDSFRRQGPKIAAHVVVPVLEHYSPAPFVRRQNSTLSGASNMQRYFFDVTNGHRLADPSGMECRSDQEAISIADSIARRIAAEAISAVERWVTVVDSEGREVAKVSVLERANEGATSGSQ